MADVMFLITTMVAFFVLLGAAAAAWGADSRDGFDESFSPIA